MCRELPVTMALLALMACQAPYAYLVDPAHDLVVRPGDPIDVTGVVFPDQGCDLREDDVVLLHQGHPVVDATLVKEVREVSAQIRAIEGGGRIELLVKSCHDREGYRDTVRYGTEDPGTGPTTPLPDARAGGTTAALRVR